MTRIAHVSDLHFGAVEHGVCEALLEALARCAPGVVAVSGDLTMRGLAKEFAAAREFLGAFPAPVICTAGNHDFPHWNWPLRFGAPMRRYRRTIAGVASDEMLLGSAQLIAVNTARPWGPSFNWSHGAFSRAQIRAVDEAFRSALPAGWRGLIAHHPFEAPPDMRAFRAVRRASSMLEVLAARRIDFALTGHLHRAGWSFAAHSERMLGRSILLIQASTATSSRRREQPNAFNVIDLGADTLTLTPWTFTGTAFEPGSAFVFRRFETGLRPEPADPSAPGAAAIVTE